MLPMLHCRVNAYSPCTAKSCAAAAATAAEDLYFRYMYYYLFVRTTNLRLFISKLISKHDKDSTKKNEQQTAAADDNRIFMGKRDIAS